MKDGLDRAKVLAQIVSLIAVPVLLAVFGYAIQASMKDSELRRDYVKIAVEVLSSEKSDAEVKVWAGQVLRENSPVPFDASLTSKLSAAFVGVATKLPSLPAEARVSRVSTPSLCETGCSRGLSTMLNKYVDVFTAAKGAPESSIESLSSALERSLSASSEIARYADLLEISGGACERIYDAM